MIPTQLVGLVPGVPAESQFARRLAEAGCVVVVPLLINRQRKEFDWGPQPAPDVTNREMLYRSAYELGRGLIGYEVQKVLALVDWWSRPADAIAEGTPSEARPSPPIGVMGWGEGGLLALYCGALDRRIDAVCVSGYFGPREGTSGRNRSTATCSACWSSSATPNGGGMVFPRPLSIDGGIPVQRSCVCLARAATRRNSPPGG